MTMKQATGITEEFANRLVASENRYNEPGLWNGKTGLAITLFHLSKYTADTSYKTKADALLDEIIEEISFKMPFFFSTGLMGIGSGMMHLINEGFAEGDPDTILSDFDRLALNIVNTRPAIELALDTGITGVGFYVYSRIRKRPEEKETMPVLKLKEHLIYLIDWIEESVNRETDRQALVDTYYLLCRVHSLKLINYKVEKLIRSCLERITSHPGFEAKDRFCCLGIESLKIITPWITQKH